MGCIVTISGFFANASSIMSFVSTVPIGNGLFMVKLVFLPYWFAGRTLVNAGRLKASLTAIGLLFRFLWWLATIVALRLAMERSQRWIFELPSWAAFMLNSDTALSVSKYVIGTVCMLS